MQEIKDEKELFVFFQFNGDNRCVCQLKCPECYGHNVRTFKHYWNGDVAKWEKAFERLNRNIYFNFSYGEALLSEGFFECVEMIGRHPNWTLNVITNLLADTKILERLLDSKLAKEKRLFLNPCWHPEGVENIDESWSVFQKHLLMVKAAGVAVHVMMVWMPFVIKRFAKYFEWLDQNDFRVGVRRFVKDTWHIKVPLLRSSRWGFAKFKLSDYSEVERGYIYAYTCPKVTKYGLDLVSPRGKLCFAGKDMILVSSDGVVKLCASCDNFASPYLGNIFSKDFKLNSKPIKCPVNNCGGDFGMLVLPDKEFGSLPDRLWRDTFISQVENIPQSSPVAYPNRLEMLKWVDRLKSQ